MPVLNKLGTLRFGLIDLIRGTGVMKALKQLHAEQYMPAEQVQALHAERLNKLFEKAKTSTRFYSQFKSYDELPVLTKDKVLSHYDGFFAKEKSTLIRKTTGGSTGVPFAYYTTRRSASFMWASLIMSWETTGYQLGEKVMFLAGSSLFKNDWKHKVFYKLLNIEILYASPLSDEIMNDYAERIKNQKTAVLYGYSYAINTFAEYLNRVRKHQFPHLKGVVCTAELLADSARAKMEKAFGVKVYDQYGCNEGGISAFECEHKNMHLVTTRAAYETDANGTLISTDLMNDGFIMMRYNTTDIVEFSHKTCRCNRTYPVIEKMIGRLNDVVVDMDKKVLHASFFGITLAKDTAIHQYQVTFNNHSINVNIHSTHNDKEYFSEKYIPLIRKYAKFDIYTVTLNKPFEKTPNGKHREVVDKRKVKEQVYTE